MRETPPALKYLPPERLALDARLQSRDLPEGQLADLEWVEHLTERIKGGDDLGPLDAVEDAAGRFWVFDGFARCLAHRAAETGSVRVLVRQGTFADAKLLSLSANSRHGMNRKEGDKTKAVNTLLDDPALLRLAEDRARRGGGVYGVIAAMCAVSTSLVRDVLIARGLHAPEGKVVKNPDPPKPPDAGQNSCGAAQNQTADGTTRGDPPAAPTDADRGPSPPKPGSSESSQVPPNDRQVSGPPDPAAEGRRLAESVVRAAGTLAGSLARYLEHDASKRLRRGKGRGLLERTEGGWTWPALSELVAAVERTAPP